MNPQLDIGTLDDASAPARARLVLRRSGIALKGRGPGPDRGGHGSGRIVPRQAMAPGR